MKCWSRKPNKKRKAHRLQYEVTYREYVSAIHAQGRALFSARESQRWRDDSKVKSDEAVDRPKFHLIIPTKQSDDRLCKTVLSAAILNYPAPTLINFNRTREDDNNPDLQAVTGVKDFLYGEQTRPHDLALIINVDTWLQLPVETMIHRFVKHTIAADKSLLSRYNPTGDSDESAAADIRPIAEEAVKTQRYEEKVMFGASKVCIGHEPGDLACAAIPDSSLASDIYGPDTDKLDITVRPRFLNSHMILGRVSDLQPLFNAMVRKMEMQGSASTDQWAFSQLFGEQEAARKSTLPTRSAKSLPGSQLKVQPSELSRRSWWPELFHKQTSTNRKVAVQEEFAPIPNVNYEYGIALDYESAIFQTVDNSISDLQSITFDEPIQIKSKSKIEAAAFKMPMQLPADIRRLSKPYKLQRDITNDLPGVIKRPDTLDLLPLDLNWTDVSLATNIIVPKGRIPAAFSFSGDEMAVHAFWAKMWYHPHARAMMRRYMRSIKGQLGAVTATKGEGQWWASRGGRGGIWTDQNVWLEWNEVCGAFSSEVFLDEYGEIGKELEEDRKPVYMHGKLISGYGPDEEPLSENQLIEKEMQEKKDDERKAQDNERNKKLEQLKEKEAAMQKDEDGRDIKQESDGVEGDSKDEEFHEDNKQDEKNNEENGSKDKEGKPDADEHAERKQDAKEDKGDKNSKEDVNEPKQEQEPKKADKEVEPERKLDPLVPIELIE